MLISRLNGNVRINLIKLTVIQPPSHPLDHELQSALEKPAQERQSVLPATELLADHDGMAVRLW